MDAMSASDEVDRIAAVLEGLDHPALILERDGRLAHANELAALIFGVDRSQLIGQKFFTSDTNIPHYLEIRAAVIRALSYPPGEQQTEVSLHIRGREHVYLLKTSSLELAGSEPFATIVMLHDVSYVRSKERARTNLISTLSNDLKTPLTSMSLGIELLQMGNNESRRQEIISSVTEDLKRIQDLADGLLDAIRADTVSIAVRNVPFGLSKLIVSVAKTLSLEAREKEIALHVNIAPDLESVGDPLKLAWVISTLIGGAVARTPDGGSIEVAAELSGKNVHLSVSDSGPAIPREVLNLVFETNGARQSNSTENDSQELALALSKEIVEAHGGRIFHEASDRGSTFVIDLPHPRCI
jgi:PAS domain S-box-containing protein